MTLRAVLKGDSIQVAVLGGFIHRPAPEDGFAVDVTDTCAFVPEREITLALLALSDLRELRSEKKRR